MPVIVIVDDQPAICFAVKAMLKPLAGNAIHTANSGANACASIRKHQPDLVILDILLNKMDGLQLLQQLSRQAFTLRAIVYSSLPPEIYASRAMRAGAAAFFSKDADIRQLVPLCQLVLQGYGCFPQSTLATLINTPAALPENDPLAALSDRELIVLRYLVSGMSNKEIASRLLLSNKTISTYKRRLLDKLQQDSIEGLRALLEPQGNKLRLTARTTENEAVPTKK